MDPSGGAIVLLIKHSRPLIDGGWSPKLMQLRGEELIFAAGERPSKNVRKHDGLTHVFLRHFWADYQVRIFDLAPGQYFLMLPQNFSTLVNASSLETRQRKVDSYPLLVLTGFASVICSLLIMFYQRNRDIEDPDPIKQAQALRSRGRTDEARAVLVWAIKINPDRAAKLRKALVNL